MEPTPSQIFDELFPDSQHADTPPDTQPIDTIPAIQLHGDSQTIADTAPDTQQHSDSKTSIDTPDECYTIESSTLVDSQLGRDLHTGEEDRIVNEDIHADL